MSMGMYLYGMIGKVKKNGGVVKCTPVFRDDVSKKYYTCTRNEDREVTCTPIDIGCYGDLLFLPASKKKIDDGKEYFFIFQSEKSKQIFNYRVAVNPDLCVGIYNNEEFCVFRSNTHMRVTEEMMTTTYQSFPKGIVFW